MGGIIKIEYYFFLHEDENVTKRLCLNELFKKPDLFDLTGFFFFLVTCIELIYIR